MDWGLLVPLVNIATLIFVAGGAIMVLRQKTQDLGTSLEGIKKDLSVDIAEIKDDMGGRMGKIEDNLDKLTVVTVQQARHDERMNAMDQRQLSQAQRIDEIVRLQGERDERMARMVENTISRVNTLADKGVRTPRD